MLSAVRRLQKEYNATQADENITLAPVAPDQFMEWNATIKAPNGSYYEGYEFDLHISVPSNYPMVPPVIKFVTKIFHPNILFAVSAT